MTLKSNLIQSLPELDAARRAELFDLAMDWPELIPGFDEQCALKADPQVKAKQILAAEQRQLTSLTEE